MSSQSLQPDESLQASPISVENQQMVDGGVFPLIYRCQTSAPTLQTVESWVRENREALEQQLQTHGTILFRGFPLQEPEDFDRFISAFGMENFPYEQSLSNAVRVNFTERVFSANEAPPEVTIFLHHEMAQTPMFPSRLFFCCRQPAEEGGATPLCRSDVLFQQICERYPKFAKDCEEKGLKYSNVMPGKDDAESGMGRSWQSTFRASNREEVEQRLGELNYSWQWLEDDCLRVTTPVLPAVREVSPGRKVFFNQLIAAFRGWKDARNDPSKAITFGDATALDRETVLAVADMAESLTFDVPWQQGDVALVDNFLVMHARRAFRGPRKVLASLATAQTHSG